MNGSDRVSAGNGICDSSPQPPTGSHCSLRANTSSRAVPVTKVGSDTPISTRASELTSNQEFRLTALSTPMGTPTSTAISTASRPRANDVGNAWAMICVQVQSRY